MPADEQKAFCLIRIQGLTMGEGTEVLSVPTKSVSRRVNCGRMVLAERLGDLRPDTVPPEES